MADRDSADRQQRVRPYIFHDSAYSMAIQSSGRYTSKKPSTTYSFFISIFGDCDGLHIYQDWVHVSLDNNQVSNLQDTRVPGNEIHMMVEHMDAGVKLYECQKKEASLIIHFVTHSNIFLVSHSVITYPGGVSQIFRLSHTLGCLVGYMTGRAILYIGIKNCVFREIASPTV
jgi:hypothetical protein